MEQIFISSVQKELQAERLALRDFVQTNDLLRQFFYVFLFEDLPPADRKPDDAYLDEVAKSPLFIGLYGDEYGWEDDNGLSPTEREYNEATAHRKRRFILIKGRLDSSRHPKMKALIDRVGDNLVRRRFEDSSELLRLLYGSLIQYLQDKGFVAAKDFDAAPCDNAQISDISTDKVKRFLERARDERRYALPVDTSTKQTLTHLNLLVADKPTRGAVMLFADHPERFVPSAEVMCLHFHGTTIAKPIPNQQVYRGTLFEVVDKAVDFVMDTLSRAVEPGSNTVASDVTYEIPYPVIREGIVNAVAHRNYASKSAVQVSVFADRVEIWNPGGLPEDLTMEQLRTPHPSVPRNRLICEPLFLAHYIERAGTGTLDMIRLCVKAGLPEPEFRSEGERFVTIVWRHWLTEAMIRQLALSDRQKHLISLVRTTGRITNTQAQSALGIAKRTSHRDLSELVEKGVLEMVGTTGKGTHYVLRKGPRTGQWGHSSPFGI